MSQLRSLLGYLHCWMRQPSSCSRRQSRRVRLEIETLEHRALPSVAATPIFNEDFNQAVGSLPSTSTWNYNNGSDPNNTAVRYVNDASTLSVMNDPNASDGKSLGMTIYPTSPGNQTFNSARINTANRPGGNVQYGLIEARIKLPGGPNGQGDGLWPAFWMLGANRQQGVAWPNCGEIDIMEQGYGGPTTISGATHFGSISGPTRSDTVATYTLPGGQGFYSGYHTFSVYWTPGSITFSVDGNAYATVKKSSYSPALWDQTFSQPFYMILNICDGGPNNSGGFAGPTTARSTFPQTMYEDYVRAYSLTGISTPTNLSATASAPNQVDLSWQAPANDETGFILQRSKTADFAAIDGSFNLAQGARSYRDATGLPGTSYFYRLQAIATDGTRAYQSSYSNAAAVTTVGTPTVPAEPMGDYSNGFAGATGLQLNGSAALVGSLLRLTNGGSNQAASVFTATKVGVSQFSTSFDFKLTNANADGFTFAVQGGSPTRIGGAGGSLGYQGMGSSLAIKFDLYNNMGEGNNSTGLYINGVVPTAAGSIDLNGTGINLHSGNSFNVSMSYDGTTLKVTITDKVTLASATQSYRINIPGIVGPTAYVGFTGGTGGASAIQDILAWTYTTQGTSTRADLAMNRPVFVSSVENGSFPATSAVDGNSTTRWSSQFSDRQWVYVDLGATYHVTDVKLNWERAAGKNYQIQVSADAASWTTITTITGNTTAGVHDYTALSGTGRYVRIYCTARATPYGYSLYDFNVYGAASAAAALGRSTWTATASTTEPGGNPTNALDGGLATRWSSGKPMTGGEWFQIDLGSVQSFNRIALHSGDSVHDYARGYRILISNNGTDWATQAPVAVASGNSPAIDVSLASAVSARFVRIVQTGTASYWWSIAELNLYG
jgi:beta-glucanase (GH16 family)